MRQLWAPPCTAHPGAMRVAYIALDAVFKRWGYRPRAGVTGACNCRRITGGTGYSLHAYFDGEPFTFWSGTKVTMGLACDVNWDTNAYGPRLVTDMPRGMVTEILALRTGGGAQVFGWGGFYSGNKDAMHYEILASPAELAAGVLGTAPPTTPKEPTVNLGKLSAPAVTYCPRPTGGGWWVCADGSVVADHAPAYGSLAGTPLNKPVVDAAATTTGNGYLLAAADGGVFPFGDAIGYGSLGGTPLNAPVCQITAGPAGYTLLTQDGGVFPFGSGTGPRPTPVPELLR